MHKSVVTSPQANMLIWNYKERFNGEGLSDPHAVDLLYLLDDEIISISTHKEKGRPTGRFEVKLAPTVNWITRLTPGSWCVINMSRDIPPPGPEGEKTVSPLASKANGKTLKWFGRIEDIRVSVDVDQRTGARMTTYVVTGSDWASIFESKLYVDNIFRNSGFNPEDKKFTAVGAAERLVYDNQALEYFKKGGLPTSEINVKGIVRLWGAPLQQITDSVNSQVGIAKKLSLTSGGKYQFPKEAANYLGLRTPQGKSTRDIADALHVIAGRLVAEDKYKSVSDAIGFIDPMSIFGTNTVWALLLDNCNNILNELVADLRIEESDNPVTGDKVSIALYSRIKPFIVRSGWEGEGLVKNLASSFFKLRQVEIPIEDVLKVDAGVSWHNMCNFVEMRPDQNLIRGISSSEFKKESQSFDKSSYERNGFKPIIARSKYIPIDQYGVLKAEGLTKWRFLLREWYFNQHNQLNGSINIVGQNKHIRVGDNIVVDSSVLGKSRNMNAEEKAAAGSNGANKINLIAHVESVRHEFRVDPVNGARSFITTIGFVRGITVPENGNVSSGMAIDKESTKLKDSEELSVDVVRTRTSKKAGQ